MKEILIGRGSKCGLVINDPKLLVSGIHGKVIIQSNKVFFQDLNSTNGTYINGKKIVSNKPHELKSSDVVVLAKSYPLDIKRFFAEIVKPPSKEEYHNSEVTVIFQQNKATIQDGKNTFELDLEKTSIANFSDVDRSPFVTIGRVKGNKIVIDKVAVSRNHCKLRLLSPIILEIEDLGSTNGTFADNEKLIPFKKYQFSSSVKIRLGSNVNLDLKKIFQTI